MSNNLFTHISFEKNGKEELVAVEGLPNSQLRAWKAVALTSQGYDDFLRDAMIENMKPNTTKTKKKKKFNAPSEIQEIRLKNGLFPEYPYLDLKYANGQYYQTTLKNLKEYGIRPIYSSTTAGEEDLKALSKRISDHSKTDQELETMQVSIDKDETEVEVSEGKIIALGGKDFIISSQQDRDFAKTIMQQNELIEELQAQQGENRFRLKKRAQKVRGVKNVDHIVTKWIKLIDNDLQEIMFRTKEQITGYPVEDIEKCYAQHIESFLLIQENLRRKLREQTEDYQPKKKLKMD